MDQQALVQHEMLKKHMPQGDDKNRQSKKYYGSMCTGMKCQATKTSNMWPVKPQMDMQVHKPAVIYQYRRLSKDRNCQATICEYNDSKGQSTVKVCSNQNCQEIMQPVVPEMNMWLPKAAVLYKYRTLCNDKNCQSTRCYNKRNYDKNCQ